MNTSFLLKYTMSFFTTLFIITFVLKVPYYITNQHALIREYYGKYFLTNIPLDFALVLIYLQIAYFAMNQLRIKEKLHKLGIVILTTICLTGGFCFYYRSLPMDSSFFSRWFHKAGYSSLLYDVILLVFVFLGIEYLDKNMI